MTASTDQFVDIAKRGQDLVSGSVRSWIETLQDVAYQSGSRQQLPDVTDAVDRVFDFYEQVLSHQREFAKTVAWTGSSVFDQVTEQAAKATEAVTEHAGANAEATAETTQKAARSTRYAR